MSNRILSLLVLFGVFAGFFLMYIYFFVYYTATITVRSNVEGYSVELYGKSVAKTFTYDCPEKVCTISDISPIEYNVTIRKDAYLDFFQNIDISPSSKQEIIITLEKEIVLEKQEPTITSSEEGATGEETSGLSAQDKIAQIRLEKTYDQLFSLDSGTQIGLKDQDLQFELYYIPNDSERLIGAFDKQETNISIKEITDTPFVYIGFGEENYLYNTEMYRLSEISFTPGISYIKKGRVSTELLFISDKGAFVYNLGAKEFSYFYFFRDFVYEGDAYIGVIYTDEEQKRSNYGLSEEDQNLIVRYTPSTQQREILLRTSLDIDKIYKKEGGIFFESGGEVYELENY